MELTNLQGEHERTAAARSRMYQLLGSTFAFPDQELYDAVRDGSLLRAITGVCSQLPYDLSEAVTKGLAAIEESYTDFESEYIRIFDVGTAGPPCPLYGGVYLGDRMKIMEDAVRFYNFFELHMSPQMHELPDHITTELEFMHYLTFREAELRQQGNDPASLLRAERDFLARHLCRWVPRLQERLAKQTTCLFFPSLVRFARGFFDSDRALATRATEES